MKLNLGSGHKDLEIDGYVNIDIANGVSAYPLDYESETVDEIRASHILEHFSKSEVENVLKSWVDKLRPGGVLKIAVPDFRKIASRYVSGEPSKHNTVHYIVGGQDDSNDYHKMIFDEDSLSQYLTAAGLENITKWTSEIEDCASYDISLNLQGNKPDIAIPQAYSDIANKRYNLYSQFEEDGIIEEIFNRIGAVNKWCLECGAADGVLFSNTRKLIESGWKAILIEADTSIFENLKKNANENCICENVKVKPNQNEGLDYFLKKHNAPKDIDLLVIDVDGQDWHLWNTMTQYSPRVVSIECSLPADKELYMGDDYIPTIGGDGQAGYKAILRLAASKGYKPIIRTKTNMICVRNDLEPMLHANKPVSEKTNIHAIMSMPRLAFTDNLYSAIRVFPPLGIGFDKGCGVFWGQILTNMMEAHLDDGTEYIITLDYDTWFTKEHVIRLCQLMAENPDVDAIVPVQVKRENNIPMFSIVDGDKVGLTKVPVSMFDKELVDIVGGHFGLTIFRVDSLRKLKKPWFLPMPDKDGGWSDGKIDEDIHFWHNFYNCGFRTCLATQINIGHIQLTCTFPGKAENNFKPEQIYMTQVERKEYPEHCVPKVEMLK